MTESCTTPLVGKPDHSGRCSALCWTRVCFGLMMERFEYSGEKGIKISVVVETFRALYYWSFLAVLGTGIFLTEMFAAIDHTAIIKEVFGAYNLCTNLDFPPSTYVLPFLYLFPMSFGIIYSSVSMFRIWIAYEEERITALEKILLWAVHLYFILSLMWFETCFAVSPDRDDPKSMVVHTLPYINLKIAYCILQIGIVHFGSKVAWQDIKHSHKWFLVVSWIHVVFQCMATVIHTAILLNALLDMGPGQLKGKGLWWSVQDSYSILMANIFGNFFGVGLNLIAPLIQSHFLAC